MKVGPHDDSGLSQPRSAGAEASTADASEPVVAVLDDDPSVRKALGRLLRAEGYQVELFASPREFLASDASSRPGCLVSDLRLPDMDGLDLFAMLRLSGRIMPIVFITGYGDVPTSVRAMKSGAVDFLTKPVEDEDLLEAVRRAIRRDVTRRKFKQQHDEAYTKWLTLTPRERQVMALVVEGLLNKQVAARLGTTEQTVKVHRKRVMQKMRADSLAGLVHLADQIGLRGLADAVPGEPSKPERANEGPSDEESD
jgi:FixJ family two-component response regulator